MNDSQSGNRHAVLGQTTTAHQVLLSLGMDCSRTSAQKIVLAAYKAGTMNDLNGRQDDYVSAGNWSLIGLIRGLEKHLAIERENARDAADALTDAIHPETETWTIRRLRRLVEADTQLSKTTLAELHRHGDGRASDLPAKMAEMGATTVFDVARQGHALPPGWIERTIERIKAKHPG